MNECQARAGKGLPWVGEDFFMQVSRACFTFMISDISDGSAGITGCGLIPKPQGKWPPHVVMAFTFQRLWVIDASPTGAK